MTLTEMRRAVTAQPFRPFVVHLADGRSLSVAHPETVVAMGRTVTVFQTNGSSHIIDLLLVTDLEVAPAAAAG